MYSTIKCKKIFVMTSAEVEENIAAKISQMYLKNNGGTHLKFDERC